MFARPARVEHGIGDEFAGQASCRHAAAMVCERRPGVGKSRQRPGERNAGTDTTDQAVPCMRSLNMTPGWEQALEFTAYIAVHGGDRRRREIGRTAGSKEKPVVGQQAEVMEGDASIGAHDAGCPALPIQLLCAEGAGHQDCRGNRQHPPTTPRNEGFVAVGIGVGGQQHLTRAQGCFWEAEDVAVFFYVPTEDRSLFMNDSPGIGGCSGEAAQVGERVNGEAERQKKGAAKLRPSGAESSDRLGSVVELTLDSEHILDAFLMFAQRTGVPAGAAKKDFSQRRSIVIVQALFLCPGGFYEGANVLYGGVLHAVELPHCSGTVAPLHLSNGEGRGPDAAEASVPSGSAPANGRSLN